MVLPAHLGWNLGNLQNFENESQAINFIWTCILRISILQTCPYDRIKAFNVIEFAIGEIPDPNVIKVKEFQL